MMEDTVLQKQNSLAPIKSRIAACLIDILIGVLALLMANAILSQSNGSTLSFLGVFVALGLLLGVVVYQTVLLSSTGQTVGKKIMRIRVVKFSGADNPGFVKAVLIRWWLLSLIYSIPYAGWGFLIADGLFMFRENRRSLHDLIAGTTVVQQAREEYLPMSA